MLFSESHDLGECEAIWKNLSRVASPKKWFSPKIYCFGQLHTYTHLRQKKKTYFSKIVWKFYLGYFLI